MVTRDDVARLAGVSPTVVSYVVNNSNYVSDEKRAAVLKAIKELDYVPNNNARSLKRRKSNAIGIVRGYQLNDMFNDLLYYIENLANMNGYTVSLTSVDIGDDYYAKDSFVDRLLSMKFAAVFVVNSSLTEKQINRIANSDTKVLLYVTKQYHGLDPRVGRIVPDYKTAVKKIISELLKLGHRKILMVPNLTYPGELHSAGNYRFSGYKEAFEEAGVPLDHRYLQPSSRRVDEILGRIERLYSGPDRSAFPTAVYTDETFIGAVIMKKLNAMGFGVPGDVSIVCSSNSTMATITTPQITAVGFNAEEVAEESFKMLEKLIGDGPAETKTIYFNYYDRESMSAPCGGI